MHNGLPYYFPANIDRFYSTCNKIIINNFTSHLRAVHVQCTCSVFVFCFLLIINQNNCPWLIKPHFLNETSVVYLKSLFPRMWTTNIKVDTLSGPSVSHHITQKIISGLVSSRDCTRVLGYPRAYRHCNTRLCRQVEGPWHTPWW
jgi:hypothetical protein